MPLSPASRLADFGTGIGTAGAVLKVDNPNQRVGIGTTIPTATLGVAGIVSATAFYGDGSNLDGVASAGLGTALSEVEFDPLTVIYQTSDTLSVGATITVDPPDATTKVAYTQYAEVKLEGDADLIVADGDDFIPDILGLSTEGFSFSNANGNGVFDTVYTDNIENAAGRGGPNFPLGITVSGVSTFSGNVSIGGTLTYEDVTNVDSIGLITARNGINVTAGGINVTTGGIDVTAGGINVTAGVSTFGGNVTVDAGVNGMIDFGDINGNAYGRLYADSSGTFIGSKTNHQLFLRTNNAERLRIGTAGQIGLSGANYGTSGQVMTSQGGSAAPQWASVAAGLTRLGGDTFTGSSSTVDIFDAFTSDYLAYKVIFNFTNSASDFGVRLGTSSAWKTSGYWNQSCFSDGGSGDFGGGSNNWARFNSNTKMGAGELMIIDPTSTAQGKITYFQGFSSRNATPNNQTQYGGRGSVLDTTDVITKAQFISEANITYLKWVLYGIK